MFNSLIEKSFKVLGEYMSEKNNHLCPGRFLFFTQNNINHRIIIFIDIGHPSSDLALCVMCEL
jgi:hypothetical protein